MSSMSSSESVHTLFSPVNYSLPLIFASSVLTHHHTFTFRWSDFSASCPTLPMGSWAFRYEYLWFWRCIEGSPFHLQVPWTNPFWCRSTNLRVYECYCNAIFYIQATISLTRRFVRRMETRSMWAALHWYSDLGILVFWWSTVAVT